MEIVYALIGGLVFMLIALIIGVLNTIFGESLRVLNTNKPVYKVIKGKELDIWLAERNFKNQRS